MAILGVDLAAGRAAVDRRGVRRRRGRAAPARRSPARSPARSGAGCSTRPGCASRSGWRRRSSSPSSRAISPSPTACSWSNPEPSWSSSRRCPVSRLWGVGPATLTKLERMGLRTIGDVAALDEQALVGALGSSLGRHLHALARNDDARAVVPEREAKSIGAEETFGADLHRPAQCERELVRLADRACARLRSADLTARTVNVKIRFGNFETRTRAAHAARGDRREHGRARRRPGAARPSSTSRAACACSACRCRSSTPRPRCRPRSTYRRRGPSNATRTERRAAVERAVDEVRDRFGVAVGPARDARRAGRRGTGEQMMRIGLVGCGHIGTVHALALQQLADAELVDARLTATYDDDPDRAGEGGAPSRRRAVRRRSTSCSTPSTSCGCAPGPPRISPRSRPRPIAGSPSSARSRSRPISPPRPGSRPRSNGSRTRSVSCCGGRPCSATWPRRSRRGSTAACSRP